MTYWGINAIFLTAAVLVLVAAVVLRRPGRSLWGALGLTAVLLFVLTAVFDNLIIAAGIVAYPEGQSISGVRIGLAPVEDFAYPLAGVLLLPALWLLLGGSLGRSTGRPTAPPAHQPSNAASAHRHRVTGDA